MNIHWAKPLDWRQAECGYVMTPDDHLPTSNRQHVSCPDCLKILAERGVEAPTPLPKEERMRRAWTIQVVGGDTDLSFAEWMYLHGHSNERPARHIPPRMVDDNGLVDGVFIFHDANTSGVTLEVVPMSTGNIEFTIEVDGKDGHFTTLHHLDRADLIRAVLHDFHYSPERGGPADD